MPKRILISCGELSGDEHAAHIVQSIKKIIPSVEIKAMGGRNLRAAGVETIVDSETSASVMGFTELFGSIGKVLVALKTMKHTVKTWSPDLLILTDFPDFNLRLAKYASENGTKVLYFISPQVWAWRAGRVEFFKKYIDKMAVIFPFEKEFLNSHGYHNAEFVGHPFTDYLNSKKHRSNQTIRQELGLSDAPLLAIFPGSRKSEIEKNLNVMLSGIKMFYDKHPEIQLILNVAPSLETEFIKNKISEFERLKIVKHDSLEVLQIADGGLLKSGTSNLQAAAYGLPFAMFYIASKVSAMIVRKFVNLKQYSIINVIKPDTVKEILQENTLPEEICKELENIMFNSKYRMTLKDKFKDITKSLQYPGNSQETAADRVAQIATQLMN